MIRFLFDMGLPRRACEDLQAEGIDAVHLGPLGLPRLPDDEVIELAVREGRTVVTLDRDFTQIIAVSGAGSLLWSTSGRTWTVRRPSCWCAAC